MLTGMEREHKSITTKERKRENEKMNGSRTGQKEWESPERADRRILLQDSQLQFWVLYMALNGDYIDKKKNGSALAK